MKSREKRNKEKDHFAKLKVTQRQTFYANTKAVCEMMLGKGVYAKFPAMYLEYMYQHRFYNPKVIAEEGSTISNAAFERLNFYLNAFIKTRNLLLNDGITKLPLALQLVEGTSFILFLERLNDSDFAAAKEIKQLFECYGTDSPFFEQFNTEITNLTTTMGLLMSNLFEGFYSGRYHFQISEKTGAINNIFYFKYLAPEKQSFNIDGNTRPATKVGWLFSEHVLVWNSVKPSQIQMIEIGEDVPMDVYIQSHALLRLDERLGLDRGMMHFSIYVSLLNPQYHWDENGRLMLEYYFMEKKLGYFVCSIHDHRVLIHSFLFITFNSTPEGKKLYQLTGLGKVDKKYLAIDTLGSFLSYAIEENSFVKDIFIQSGCEVLLDLEQLKSMLVDQKDQKVSADIIAKYLTNHANIPQFNVSIL